MTLHKTFLSSVALLALAVVITGCGHGHSNNVGVDSGVTDGGSSDSGSSGGDSTDDGSSTGDDSAGDGTADGDGSPTRPISYAEEDGTAAAALSNGVTLETEGFTSSAQSFGGPIDASFAIKKNDQGAVDVTVNGETYTFSKADKTAEGDGWETPDRYVGTWNYPDADAALTPSGSDGQYAQVWQYYLDPSEGDPFNGFAIVGTETKADVLKTQAAATYDGAVVARFRETDGSNTETDVRAGFSQGGSLTMTADFDKATISGEATGFKARVRTIGGAWTPYTDVNGTVTMEEVKIDGNSYKGNLSGTGDFQDALEGDATYSGRFYGPDAEETAGTIGYSNDPDTTGVGFFHATKQP